MNNMIVTNMLIGIVIVILYKIYEVSVSILRDVNRTRLETQTIRKYIEHLSDEQSKEMEK